MASPADETTRLLPRDDARPASTEAGTPEATPCRSTTQLLGRELAVIAWRSLPVSLTYALQNSLAAVSVVIVGRLSPADLATAAFAYMWASSTCWVVALGGATALDTLGAAAYTAVADPHELGVLLQRALLTLSLLYIPVVATWVFAEPIFLMLRQDPQIASGSAIFLWYFIPGGLGYIVLECLKRFLQAQGLMRAGTYVLLVTAPLNALLNYLLVHRTHLGILGAPIATGVTFWTSVLLLVGYTYFVQGSKHWGGWTWRCLDNIPTMLRLELNGIAHVGSEWWAFEIVAIVAGQLGTFPLAAQSIIMNTDIVMNAIPFGIGVATSSRVGNMLGARNARGAARASHTAVFLSVLCGGVILTALMATRHSFGKIFNDDPRVVELTAEVLPAVALFQIADAINCSCGGSLRGMGRQHLGAIVNIVSYYFIALPLGIWLAWHGWGLIGLWTGQCIALYLVGILQWVIVTMSDWEKQSRLAIKRLDAGEAIEGGALIHGDPPPTVH